MPSKRDILDFLKRIENGDVTLTPRDEPQAVFAGTVEYDADNSWSIGVFNDANQWDYIEWIATDGGERLEFRVPDRGSVNPPPLGGG